MKNALILLAAGSVLLPGTVLAAPADQETTHVVLPGETLYGIANRAGVDATDIARSNDLAPPYVVRIGQRLHIPRRDTALNKAAGTSDAAPRRVSVTPADATTDSHVVMSGETLSGIARAYGSTADSIAKANNLSAPFIVKVGQRLMIPRPSLPAPKDRTRTSASGLPPARPSLSPQTSTADSHIVSRGETLSSISRRVGVSASLIAEANGFSPPFTVKAGQKLVIPRTRHHTVKAGETTFSIAYDTAVPWEQIATANNLDPQKPVKPGQVLLIPTLIETGSARPATPPAVPAPVAAPVPAARAPAPESHFAWPTQGKVRRNFSAGSAYHDGIDIAAPRGTPVLAAATGTVVFAGRETKYKQFGNLVVIDNGQGWATAYGFLQTITVRKGAHVAAGERLGTVGSTGLAKGTELHFEIRHDGVAIDPLDELPKAP